MRSIMLLAAMSAGLFVAACSGTGPDGTTDQSRPGGASAPASVGSPSGGPGPSGAGVDKKTVCAAYQKAEDDAEAKLAVVVPKAAEAIANPSKAAPVLTELKTILATFEAALKAEAGRPDDAQLRAAIHADVAVLAKVQQDLAAAGNDVSAAFAAINTEQFTAAGEKVKALCAK